jgi:addiction module HigA family antidote
MKGSREWGVLAHFNYAFYNRVNKLFRRIICMARVSTKLPGVVIAAALKTLGATVEKLEEVTKIPLETINAIINGTEPVTAELSVKLGQALGEKDRYFAELQLTHDVVAAAKSVEKIAKLRKPAGRKPGVKAAGAPPAKRGRKPGVKVEAAAPAKRGRKPGVKAADAVPAKRGRKPGVKAADTVPAKRGRKPGPKPKA